MILFSLLAPIRVIGVWLDALVFGLVDDAYNVIGALTSASLFDSGAVAELRKNIYVVIGVFAIFRLAVSLVNTIIDPEKLTDSSAGAHIILRNVVLMFVLLIITPMIFSELRQFQQLVVENHYIDKLLMVGNTGDVSGNPGKTMQKIAIKSLIYPDTRLYDKETDEFDDACDDDCKEAINEYNAMMESNNPVNWLTISSNMGVNVKYKDSDGAEDTVFAYHYYFIITLVFAGFLAYIMYSFAIDIAIRNIKFVILEVLSPLFIATIIDPKSMKSGPFHEWFSMCVKIYTNLFIRLAAISMMLVLVSLLETTDLTLAGVNKGIEGIATIILLIGILIFVKSAPKWISGLLGAKGDDGDMGGLFKKIGSAALIGGAATKAGHALYGAGTSALRNAHEARKNQKRSMANQGGRAHNNLASNYRSNRQDGGRISSAARAVGQSYFSKDAIKRNTSNWGKTAAAGGLGFLGGMAAGASIGVKGGDLKDINAKVKADSSSRFKSYGDGYKTLIEKGTEKIRSAHTSNVEKVFGTEKEAKFNSLAVQKFGKVAVDSSGKRDPLLNPVTTGEVNNLVKTIRKDKHSKDPVLSKLSASNPEDIAKALVQQRIDTGSIKGAKVVAEGVQYTDTSGKTQTVSAMNYCSSNNIVTKYGAADIQATAKEIAYNRASEYASNQTRISQEQQTIATTNGQILTIQNNVKATFGDDALRDVQALDRTISERNKLERDLQKAKSNPKSKPEDIRDLEKSLADATDSIKTLGAAIDGRMGEGAANGYEAALKAREDSIAAVEKLTEYNQEIKDEVAKAHSGNPKEDNFKVTDPMTKEEQKFLEDPTKIELIVNLLNEEKDKERKKADKILNPSDSKDSNGGN